MTAARLDPAPALSRRSAMRANLCRRWRLRMFYRWQCDPLDLRFPIPNEDVLDSLNAAKRQLAADRSAADARWADEISTKGGAQQCAALLTHALRPCSASSSQHLRSPPLI